MNSYSIQQILLKELTDFLNYNSIKNFEKVLENENVYVVHISKSWGDESYLISDNFPNKEHNQKFLEILSLIEKYFETSTFGKEFQQFFKVFLQIVEDDENYYLLYGNVYTQ